MSKVIFSFSVICMTRERQEAEMPGLEGFNHTGFLHTLVMGKKQPPSTILNYLSVDIFVYHTSTAPG